MRNFRERKNIFRESYAQILIPIVEKPFSALLIEYQASKKWTQKEMSEFLGMSERMYQYYIGGKYDGQPARIKKYTDKLSGITASNNNEGTPIFDISATAGGMDNISQLPEVPSYHVKIPGYEDCNFGMFVFGHSMYPTIETGSLVLCRKINDKRIIMYGEIYLIRTADYLMVKRLQKNSEKGYVLCTSDNFESRSQEFKRFESFELPIDAIIDLYIVKGIIKKTQS